MQVKRSILRKLQETLTTNYEDALKQFPHIKPKVHKPLVDGFKSGVREGTNHTCAMLGITITED